jgi:hypothetical protein
MLNASSIGKLMDEPASANAAIFNDRTSASILTCCMKRFFPRAVASRHLDAGAGCRGGRALEIIDLHGTPHVVDRGKKASTERRNQARRFGDRGLPRLVQLLSLVDRAIQVTGKQRHRLLPLQQQIIAFRAEPPMINTLADSSG